MTFHGQIHLSFKNMLSCNITFMVNQLLVCHIAPAKCVGVLWLRIVAGRKITLQVIENETLVEEPSNVSNSNMALTFSPLNL